MNCQGIRYVYEWDVVPQALSCSVVPLLPSTHTVTVPPHRATHTCHIVNQEPEINQNVYCQIIDKLIT